ncbi:MAG: thioredoxin family protein [Mariniblastus sp.]
MKSNTVSFSACVAALFLSSVSVAQVESEKVTDEPAVTRVANNRAIMPLSSTVAINSSKRGTAIRQMQPTDDIIKLIDTSPGVVLIDFYAGWCAPCRAQSAILSELDETARFHNASVIKINIDQHPKMKELFKIKTLPTLFLLKNKKIVERHIGIAGHGRVVELLSK